jgi:hypothetical protein
MLADFQRKLASALRSRNYQLRGRKLRCRLLSAMSHNISIPRDERSCESLVLVGVVTIGLRGPESVYYGKRTGSGMAMVVSWIHRIS